MGVSALQPLHGICIHSHFYQPPREDPWLDSVMKDQTAAPSHDWNARVYEECYRPNRAARLFDSNGEIVYITNNYRHLSFNVGPTLHSWLARHDPLLSQSIVDADRAAGESLGAGGAIAQAYNHMILPLSVARDIKTQVVWGKRDFRFRFGRDPEGMWLPETAVDTATLEALAAEGIKFTILAPHQCAAIRPHVASWRDTPGGDGLDVTRPYFTTLPSGATIALVFYYGSIAHDIAFGGLLDNGDRFAEALLGRLPVDGEPRLLAIATDGETYGHHHRFGEMALARAFQRLSDSQEALLTNIASFLKMYPPTWECRIAEDTSWSCAHGVERWRSDCGCHTGGEPGWNQKWRAPLRAALDRIRDRIDETYEKEMSRFCDSPWVLRDDAIDLYLMNFSKDARFDEVAERKRDFLKKRCGDLSGPDLVNALSLIEAQRMRMFMYTSCGWFFNDIAGIETRQILAYALRAVEYTREVSGVDLEKDFMRDLALALGNTKEQGSALDVMKRHVLPSRRSMRDVAASAALLGEKSCYHVYRIQGETRNYPSGDIDLSVREMTAFDTRTLENWSGSAAVVTAGGLDDVCRLSERKDLDPKMIRARFYEGDILSFSRYLEENFELGSWTFRNLAANDRETVASERTREAELGYLERADDLLEANQRLLVQLNMMKVEASPLLLAAANLVYKYRMEGLQKEVAEALELLKPGSSLEILLEEAHGIGVYPELSVLAPRMEIEFHDNLQEALGKNDEKAYADILTAWRRAAALRIEIDRWRLQNQMWRVLSENSDAPGNAILALANDFGFATPGKATRL